MKNVLLLCLLSILAINLNAQNLDKKAHREKVSKAENLFEKGAYQEAAKAYQQIINTSPHQLYSTQMLNAAIAFAEINEEKIVQDYLNRFSKFAINGDILKVRELAIFQKYRTMKWWIHLEESMDRRIESLIQHHKNLVVYNHHKKIIYSAIRINVNGDTLANTKIHMIPNGTGWGSPTASSQSEVVYIYESTDQDSIEHIQELRDIVDERFWNCIDTTGVIENEEKVWMHPFRNNEFFKTEIAPFPLVHFPINYETMLKARSKILIMRNWGTYSPTITEEKYFYIGTEKKNYNFSQDLVCHKFEAYGHNSVHGISHIEYFFHPQFGFTEMNYLTYDNDKIKFKMELVSE